MTPQEEKLIKEWHDTLPGPIEIGLDVTEDKRSAEFARFCDDLTRVAPKIVVSKEMSETEEAPALRISRSLRYHAIPLGRELPPFLEAIFPPNGSQYMAGSGHEEKLQSMKLPALLKLYVMQQCPVCPQAVRQISSLTTINSRIQLIIIDGILFPEMAQADGVQGAPTLLLDEAFRWTGPLRLGEIVDSLVNRDPGKLGLGTLENVVLEGRALQLAQMMLERGQIFPAFLDLLSHERLPVRLGAMVAMEEVVEKNPTLANEVIEPLWKRFPSLKDPVKGDMLYVFGILKNNQMIPRLQTILKGPYNDEVKEAAEEALDKIAQ
jgi:hypothetical protein